MDPNHSQEVRHRLFLMKRSVAFKYNAAGCIAATDKLQSETNLRGQTFNKLNLTYNKP